MPYDFSKQKEMLNATIALAKEFDFYDKMALGGGTALSGFYWNHRYSTDIDIFIYGDKNNYADKLNPRQWSSSLSECFKEIGFDGDFKLNDIYTEFKIDQDCKIQIFDTRGFTSLYPCRKEKLWGRELNIETIDEIIAKKIYYRGYKGNSRDIFDIAVAINEDPCILSILMKSDNGFREKFIEFEEAITEIIQSDQNIKNYNAEMDKMDPTSLYYDIKYKAPAYLHNVFEQLNYLINNISGSPTKEELIEIVSYSGKMILEGYTGQTYLKI